MAPKPIIMIGKVRAAENFLVRRLIGVPNLDDTEVSRTDLELMTR